MTTRQLTEAIYDSDVRTVNFFNGRLLTAEDLSKEQNANREERQRIGKAIGDGIAYGLEVTPTVGMNTPARPTVTITPGLAIDRRGQTLALTETVDLSLVRDTTSGGTSTAATFDACQADSGVYVAGAGLYLLTISTVEGREGRALVSGLGNIQASCNTKYSVPGVKFRLLQLDLDPADLNEPNLLRNKIAYRCFGSDDVAYQGLYANLFGPPVTQYGLLDQLRPNRLANCEVPLALLYWTSTAGLVFVDMWAVRRRITAPEASSRWPVLTGGRREAEGEAMFMQFQEHLAHLFMNADAPTNIRARDHFRYVPAAGIMPLSNVRHPRGFNESVFLDSITRRETLFIEGARVEFLLRTSFSYPPLDPASGVMLWVYRVRENSAAIDQNLSTAPQPYLIFTSGHMPYLGDAHYDVNRWGYSNLS
jgi:hypothetical protein